MQDPLKGRRLLLERISDAANTAPDALARIALYIVNDPEAVLTLSIADFAHLARSGSASVIRFCRMLGFSGFREFRIALCSEIERRKAFQLAKRAAPKDVIPTSANQNRCAQSRIPIDMIFHG
ncbi:MurR/RpiR family transcriptional regulator [Rhizobium sp. T1473]|uniref:MurR/RpiR family transcriptional regulator n=1 Tax=unclassified Rhizobium TaxID=2613769 RepID=UPI001AAEFFE7|nr:hypothetical protein [Rhizobium sp. T1473]